MRPAIPLFAHCIDLGNDRFRLRILPPASAGSKPVRGGVYTSYIATTAADVMTIASTRKKALLLNFKVDTLTTVSRASLRRIAKALGFSETQAVHFALARLRQDAHENEDRPY